MISNKQEETNLAITNHEKKEKKQKKQKVTNNKKEQLKQTGGEGEGDNKEKK